MKIKITENQYDSLIINTLNNLINENSDEGKMFCSSFSNSDEKRYCQSIETKISSPSLKNILKNRINKIYTSFKEKNTNDLMFDNIKNHESFFNKQKNHLESFIESLGDGCEKLKNTAQKKLIDLEKNGAEMLLYKKKTDIGDEISYSYFNRLNTNYSALAVLITEYGLEKNITNNVDKLIDDFINNPDVPDFIFRVLSEPNLINKKILNTITSTRQKGNKTEEEFKKYLESKEIPFLDFSDDFGSVDFMGVDLLVKFPDKDYYSPVQVKSREKNFSEILLSKYDEPNCKCYLIFPNKQDDKPWIRRGGNSITTNKDSEVVVNCRSINKNKENTLMFCNNPSTNKINHNVTRIKFIDRDNVFLIDKNKIKQSSLGSFYWPNQL
jgi:hypothetical protein